MTDVDLFWRDSVLNSCSWLKNDFGCEPADIFIHSDYMAPIFERSQLGGMQVDRNVIRAFLPYDYRSYDSDRRNCDNLYLGPLQRKIGLLKQVLRGIDDLSYNYEKLHYLHRHERDEPSCEQAILEIKTELDRILAEAGQPQGSDEKDLLTGLNEAKVTLGAIIRELHERMDECECHIRRARCFYDDNQFEIIEELPRLPLPLDGEIVSFPEHDQHNGRVFFAMARGAPMLYVVGMNEALCAQAMLPTKAKLGHIVRVRYGNTMGGGIGSGCFIYNMLERLGVELLVTDIYNNPMEGDRRCYKLYPEMRGSYNLNDYHRVASARWSEFPVNFLDCSPSGKAKAREALCASPSGD